MAIARFSRVLIRHAWEEMNNRPQFNVDTIRECIEIAKASNKTLPIDLPIYRQGHLLYRLRWLLNGFRRLFGLPITKKYYVVIGNPDAVKLYREAGLIP